MELTRQAIINAKILLGIGDTSQDTKLALYGDLAEHEALHYTKNSLAAADDMLLARMIAEKYKTNGNKGLKSQSYSGVSETYIDSTYSNEIMSILQSYRKLQVV